MPTEGRSRIRFGLSLREAALQPERRAVEVVCIRPGLSRNGNYYGEGALREALPLFEGARAYVDHAEGQLRSVRDLAGTYREARLDDDGAVRCTLAVARHQEWLWSLIRESVEEGSDLVGLSVDVSAQCREGEMEGRRCRIVERITALHSVDVITRAAAGGRFESLAEADRGSWWDQGEPENEEAAALAGTGLASGLQIEAQQRAVSAGAVAPVQFGPSAAQRIAGGQVLAGGTYVSDEMQSAGQAEAGRGAQGARGGSAPTGSMALAEAVPSQAGQERGSEAIAGQATRAGRHAGLQAGQERQPETATSQGSIERLLEELREERARFGREMAAERALLQSERLLDEGLRRSGLPRASVRRLEGQLGGQALDEAGVRAAIGAERDYLAALTRDGLIRGLGYEKSVQVTMTEGERLQRAFDQLFDLYEGERVPALSGIREAYVAATRDLEVSGNTDPTRLREADTTTSSFSYLLGTSMNKRLLKDYQAWPSEWQKFCTITPIKDFKQQDRIRLGAFGSLSTVGEDTAYSTISLSDTRATYTPAKRGNLVAITRETIVNDDLYAIKQIPGKLAVSAAFTLAEFVYALLAANGAAIYDTYKLFDSVNHTNTGITTANLGTPGSGASLSSANLQTAVTKMRRQTNLAGKPIGLKPRYLVVPPELEWQAMVITKSAGAPGNNYNDINPMLGYCEVIVAPQIASATSWLAVADPRVVDTVEVGFVGGQLNPQLFIQDQPLFGNNFTNDVITYKVRHEYGGAVVDYRGFYLGNN